MKKELSPAIVAIIAVVVIALVGGLGYTWFSRTTGADAPSKAEEVQRYQQAKSFYDKMGKGAPGGPPGSGAEYEARQKGGGGTPAAPR